MSSALVLPRPMQGPLERFAALWRTYPRESLGIGILSATALVAAALGQWGPAASPAPSVTPPAPPPMVIRKLAPAQAVAVNQAIPVTASPNPAARPFALIGNAAARAQALQCLSSAVYYEAGSQDDDGERAVAQVVLNRVRHPAFPGSVCGVVYQGSTRATGCQFTFTCNGSLERRPDAEGWKRAQRIASAALAGAVYAPVGWATHYHANYVVPYWASTLAKSAIVGAHIFYRWAGGWGQPAVFAKAYGGQEPDAGALRSAALAAEAATIARGPSGVAEVLKEVPGAERLAPSMRGDQRVAVRFNLIARKATDEAPHKAYVEQFKASDNLRWALSDDPAAVSQKPLGKAAPAAGGSSAAAGAQR